MQAFTFPQLCSAALVIGAVITAYNLLSTALKNYRDQKTVKNAPIAAMKDDIKDHSDKLDRDKRRLDALDERGDMLEDGLYCLMRCNLNMTRHMLHGNNVDGLNSSEKEITDFLTKKGKYDHE